MNDFDFYDKLDVEQQKIIIKELREINKLIRVEKPYRLTLLESDMPIMFKACAIKKISSLRYMEPGSGEYNKLKNKETELLKTVSPSLNPFFKKKVNEYFNNFEE